ncbi:MAG: SGNH/GDSL hydrolase family protein, partial [Planctomycetota bacterium]
YMEARKFLNNFVENMKTMVDRIRAAQARPVILSASPINDGAMLAKLGRNQRLNEYAVALTDFATGEKIPYADQFHALVDVWGLNKPRENLANLLGPLTSLANDDSLTGVEHLRDFLAAQAENPRKPVSMQGDPVHPGPNGQLMMAAALLKALGADGFVSSVTIDAGKVVEAKGCQVDGISVSNDGVEFDRLDERLPFPIPDGTVDVMPLFPAIEELSQYMLTVKGLARGSYTLAINGMPVGTLTHDQLAAGVNLTSLVHQPPAKQENANALLLQSRAILNAVAQKEGLVSQWRGLSKNAIADGAPAELKTQLADLTNKVEEADAKIRDAARPQKLRFSIMPTNR